MACLVLKNSCICYWALVLLLGNNRGMLMLLLIVDAGTDGGCFDKRVVGNELVKLVEVEGLVLYFRNLYNVRSVVQCRLVSLQAS